MFHLALMMFFSHIHLKVSLHGKSAPSDESVKTQFSLPWPLGSTDPQKLKKRISVRGIMFDMIRERITY